MHEMSLAESIIQIVEENAHANNAARVTAVRLEIGALAGVEADALRFCFDAVTRGTLAEGAALEIDSVKATAACFDCGASVTIAARLDPCPECGGNRLMPQGGDEMRVKDIAIA
jgi:hydrogenase nickel incorporation protein HypA/HybF